jgi:hypothetical protein
VPARRVVQGITEPPRAWTRVIANSASAARGRLERETGIEPATNSLEGCDSTTELLPPTCGRPPDSARTPRRCEAPLTRDTVTTPDHAHGRDGRLQILPANRNSLEEVFRSAKVGGEGRVRTSVATRTADLQSAAIDRSATSPNSFLEARAWQRLPRTPTSRTGPAARSQRSLCCHLFVDTMFPGASLNRRLPSVELAEGFEPPTG